MPPSPSHEGEAAGIGADLEIGAANHLVAQRLPESLAFQDQGSPGVVDRQAKDPPRPAAQEIFDAEEAADRIAGLQERPLDLLGGQPLHPEGIRAAEAELVGHSDDRVKVRAEDVQGILGDPA